MKTILKEDILGLLDLVKGKDMYLIKENGEAVIHKKEIKEWVRSLNVKYGFIIDNNLFNNLFNSIIINRGDKRSLIIHFDTLSSVTSSFFIDEKEKGFLVYEISPRTFLIRDKVVRAETAYEVLKKFCPDGKFDTAPMVSVLKEVY